LIEIPRRVLLTALGSLSALSGVTGVTSAQSTDGIEEEAQDAAEEATGATETATEQEQETALAQVSPTVTLVDFELSDPSGSTVTITATLDLDTPSLISTSDLLGGVASQGVTQVEQQQTTLPSGRAEVSMEVGTFEDEYAAMGLAAAGGAVTISTGLPREGQQDQLTLTEGLAYGGSTALLGTGVAAWRRTRSDLDEPEEVDLDGL